MKNKITIRKHLTLIFGIFSLLITSLIAITFNISVADSFDQYAITKNHQQLSETTNTTLQKNSNPFGLGNGSSKFYQLNSVELELKDSINRSILIIGIFSFFISLIIGYLISRKLSKPLKDLTFITKEIEEGNYEIEINSKTKIEEIYSLGLSLEKMAHKIDESIQHDKRVSQDVQHEIRTPLTNLKAQIEAMLDGVWELNNENIELCLNEVDRLGLIVDQLHQLGNIENNLDSITPTSFSFKELINSIIIEFSITSSKKNMKILNEISNEVLIINDYGLLKTALYNLISNSIRYSGDGSIIRVNQKKYMTGDNSSPYYDLIKKKGNINNNYQIISVEDNGIGIPSDKLDLIFERFYRVDKSRARKLGGSGLGLSIVNAIVIKLGGFIDVESIENEKTTFSIYLPE